MQRRKFVSFTAAAIIVLAAGCHKQQQASVDTGAFKTALNTYYQSHPICTWNAPKQFPVDLSEKPDPVQQQQLDALVTAGMLSKKKTEKTTTDEHHRRHREHVTEYDLTDQGKSAAKAGPAANEDQSTPAAKQGQEQSAGANFCVGSPTVASIDNYAEAPDTSHYNVSFHFSVGNLRGWANNDQIQAAFPRIAAITAAKKVAALAKLTKIPSGWQASGVASILVAPPQ